MPYALNAAVHDVEMYDESDVITVHRMPLDEAGELVEDNEEYDFEVEVHGDGRIAVYPKSGEPFSFNLLDPGTRSLLTSFMASA